MTVRRVVPLLLLFAVVSGCRVSEKVSAPAGIEARPSAGLESHGDDRGNAGGLYVMTNATSGNAVLAFERRADGSLAAPVRYETGGSGTGGGLGNQGALALDEDG